MEQHTESPSQQPQHNQTSFHLYDDGYGISGLSDDPTAAAIAWAHHHGGSGDAMDAGLDVGESTYGDATTQAMDDFGFSNVFQPLPQQFGQQHDESQPFGDFLHQQVLPTQQSHHHQPTFDLHSLDLYNASPLYPDLAQGPYTGILFSRSCCFRLLT